VYRRANLVCLTRAVPLLPVLYIVYMYYTSSSYFRHPAAHECRHRGRGVLAEFLRRRRRQGSVWRSLDFLTNIKKNWKKREKNNFLFKLLFVLLFVTYRLEMLQLEYISWFQVLEFCCLEGCVAYVIDRY